MAKTFLSTPSARRATQSREKALQNQIISIHALREEGDKDILMGLPLKEKYFYPRPPRGGRRLHWPRLLTTASISIHALREEGDA